MDTLFLVLGIVILLLLTTMTLRVGVAVFKDAKKHPETYFASQYMMAFTALALLWEGTMLFSLALIAYRTWRGIE